MTGTDPRTEVALNPTQRATFDQLLVVGGERPYARAGLAEALREHLNAKVSEPLRRWTEPSLWLSKGALFSVRGCEGAYVANRDAAAGAPAATDPIPLPVVVGTVTHRAIQMLHTHPGKAVEEVVRAALDGSRTTDEKVAQFLDEAPMSAQSDLIVAATSRTMGFIDSWPALHPTWAPRFEEPIAAKIDRLSLSGRVDLMLGRPRPDGKQTMVLADWKSGALKDEHEIEAAFYALLSTLRFGIPPFRSVIFSLASGSWTEPDVTEAKLFAAADWVAESVGAIVDLLTESRKPQLVAGPACSWCPARSTCPEVAAPAERPRAVAAAAPVVPLNMPGVGAPLDVVPPADEEPPPDPYEDADPYGAPEDPHPDGNAEPPTGPSDADDDWAVQVPDRAS